MQFNAYSLSLSKLLSGMARFQKDFLYKLNLYVTVNLLT